MNSKLNTETEERISIEFWDPDNPRNKCIVDRVDLLTYRQIVKLSHLEYSMMGRTELKIRRMDQPRPSDDELEKRAKIKATYIDPPYGVEKGR